MVAILFARADSNYKAFPGVDVWDAARDARKWPGGTSVVSHPPCRAWGRLRRFARPRKGERALAIKAIRAVRKWGGVLEHPAHSTLFDRCGLPRPGQRDAYGGFTIGINQNAFGHRAEKPTWLYICGIEPKDLPPIPFVMGEATHVIQSRKRGDYRPHVSKAEREHTPPALCAWLIEVARRCNPNPYPEASGTARKAPSMVSSGTILRRSARASHRLSCASNCAGKPARIELRQARAQALPSMLGHGAKEPCQDRKYARSGGAADAVREHSFSASLDASPTRVDAPDRSSFFFSLLTPARWEANKLAVQISGPSGLGGLVLGFQHWNRCRNHQTPEIISYLSPVLGFQPVASRHARVRTHVGLRAYVCARKARTLEPRLFIYTIHMDIGSAFGSSARTLEPALSAMPQALGFPSLSIKIGGRYVGNAPDRACRGLMRGGECESFGVFARAGCAWAGSGELGAASAGALLFAGRSDGFLRVSAGRARHVGMQFLECSAQRRSNALVFAIWPLPIGKADALAGMRALAPASHPPMPPFRSRPSSSSLAHDRGRILIGLSVDPRRLNHIGTRHCRLSGAGRKNWHQTGLGEAAAAQLNPPVAGRGCNAAGKLRRFRHANGGAPYVN